MCCGMGGCCVVVFAGRCTRGVGQVCMVVVLWCRSCRRTCCAEHVDRFPLLCRRARLDAPTPAAWAAAAVRQIGREATFTPYWFHGLQQAVIRLAPEWLINRQVMRMHQGFRARFYRRQARDAAEAAAAAAAEATAAGSEGEDGEETAMKRQLRRRK